MLDKLIEIAFFYTFVAVCVIFMAIIWLGIASVVFVVVMDSFKWIIGLFKQ